MNAPKPLSEDFSNLAVDAAIKIFLIGILAFWCLDILRPFAVILIWAGIMAIATHPLCQRIAGWLGGRVSLSATLLSLLAVCLLLGPVAAFVAILVGDAQDFLDALANDTLQLPGPDTSVRDWPVIGVPIYDFWSLAATNLKAAASSIGPQLKGVAEAVLSGFLGASLAVLQFLAAFLIAGFLLTRPDRALSGAEALARRVVGTQGPQLVTVMISTIRNVARGVLGTAVIQTFFAGLGMVVAGVPGAGIWTAICLVLSIVQIGPGLVLIGTIIYMFSEASTVIAVIYMIWAIAVMIMDNFLKPILMGRGSEIPIVVLFLGVIGGTLAYGIIGVFVGPVILAVGYTLFSLWVAEADKPAEPAREGG
jgi:predicted PurR-regulated permease PerM